MHLARLRNMRGLRANTSKAFEILHDPCSLDPIVICTAPLHSHLGNSMLLSSYIPSTHINPSLNSLLSMQITCDLWNLQHPCLRRLRRSQRVAHRAIMAIVSISSKACSMQNTPHPGAIGQVINILDSAGDSFLHLPYGMQPIIQKSIHWIRFIVIYSHVIILQ